MNTTIKPLFVAVPLALLGCTEKAAQTEARQHAEANARAEAAKKDMETLPKVFSTPDYLKKNEPAKVTNPPRTKAKIDPPKK